MRLGYLVLLVTLLAHQAMAVTPRILNVDSFMSADNTKTWTPPATSDTLVGRATTDTLTNKTIDGGTNTFAHIPASALGSSVIGVPNGGSGLATLTLNGILFGNGTGNAGMTAAGTQYQILQAGASGVPTFGPVNLAQSAAITGILGTPDGGLGLASPTSGSLLAGNGSSAVALIAPGTSGNALISNGSSWQSQALPGAAPVITGSAGTPSAITAGGGIAFGGAAYSNIWFIQGSGGAVTVSANPQISAGTNVGQSLVLVGESSMNTVTIQDGTGLSLNGTWVAGQNSVISLLWDGTNWVETSRR